MLITAVGLLLLLSGLADRFPLIGPRTNRFLAAVGAAAAVLGVATMVREQVTGAGPPDASPESDSREAIQ